MKDIKKYILEGQKHVDTATIADYYQWACLNELPDGKCDKSSIDYKKCEDILNYGFEEHFGMDLDNIDNTLKEVAEFFKKNWDKQIKITSEKIDKDDWRVSFDLDGKTYRVGFVSYFGDDKFE